MGWNFRVVKAYYNCPIENTEHEYLMITEVYYEDDTNDRPYAFVSSGVVSAVSDDHDDDAEGIESLRLQLERQRLALDKPILDEKTAFRSSESTPCEIVDLNLPR